MAEPETDLIDRLRKLRVFVATFYGAGHADATAMDDAIAIIENHPAFARDYNRAIEALKEIHMECLDEGHTDTGVMGDPCGQRGQVIRCGICVALESVREALGT